MRLSIVIPAFNEEKELPICLAGVSRALEELGQCAPDVELIVTDNNSTDATAEVARQHGARVVFEPVNQIGRARNAGAAVATGDWILFIDADSRLQTSTLQQLLDVIDTGQYAAGGCLVALTDVPWWGRPIVWTWNTVSRVMRYAAGSFIFCRAIAFRDVGGFDTELYAAEELDLSRKLKQWAKRNDQRFVILKDHPHVSSGRKFQLYSKWEIFSLCSRSLLRFRHVVRNRRKLDYFYDGRR